MHILYQSTKLFYFHTNCEELLNVKAQFTFDKPYTLQCAADQKCVCYVGGNSTVRKAHKVKQLSYRVFYVHGDKSSWHEVYRETREYIAHAKLSECETGNCGIVSLLQMIIITGILTLNCATYSQF